MNRMKKILLAVCISVWTCLCAFIFWQHNRISELRAQNQNAKMLCEESEKELLTYEGQNRDIPQKLEEYKQLEAETDAEMMFYEDVEQAFHGTWRVFSADEFYRQYLEKELKIEVKGSGEELPFFIFYDTQSIGIGGGRIPITKEPRYRFRICRKEELFQELEHVGIGTDDIDALLGKNYCVEMYFDSFKEWDRMIYPEEERFIHAKYYPLNFKFMLCIPQDESGELFFMRRFIDTNVDE